MIMGIKTAFLYGDARRSMYIELPAEDPMSKSGNFVGRLCRSFYGTRDAPMIWQDHLRATLLRLGFEEAATRPGYFRHRDRDLDVCVHVGDLLTAGEVTNLKWMRDALLEVYDLKAEMIGADDGMSKEAVYLGRNLKWVPDEGVRVHPDQRHVQRLLKYLGLEDSQGLSTPCAVRMDSGKGVVDITKPKELLPKLPPQQARRHRAGVARVVYLSQDRVDLVCWGRARKDHGDSASGRPRTLTSCRQVLGHAP